MVGARFMSNDSITDPSLPAPSRQASCMLEITCAQYAIDSVMIAMAMAVAPVLIPVPGKRPKSHRTVAQPEGFTPTFWGFFNSPLTAMFPVNDFVESLRLQEVWMDSALLMVRCAAMRARQREVPPALAAAHCNFSLTGSVPAAERRATCPAPAPAAGTSAAMR